MSKTDQIIEYLREAGKPTSSDDIYVELDAGEDEAERKRAYAILSYLVKQKRIVNCGGGMWQIADHLTKEAAPRKVTKDAAAKAKPEVWPAIKAQAEAAGLPVAENVSYAQSERNIRVCIADDGGLLVIEDTNVIADIDAGIAKRLAEVLRRVTA